MKLAPRLHRIGNDIIAAYLVEDDARHHRHRRGLAGHWSDLIRELDGDGANGSTTSAP